jgi:anti-sigma regulatory factor (Ser/Thr protein kinase)
MSGPSDTQFAFLGPATDSGLSDCRRQLEISPVYQELPPRLRFATDLALDELATNTIKYGNSDGASFEFAIHRSDGQLEIRYADQGSPFDPWARAGVEDERLDSIEDTLIGGRGLIMLKEISAVRSYDRRENRNLISLTVTEDSGFED